VSVLIGRLQSGALSAGKHPGQMGIAELRAQREAVLSGLASGIGISGPSASMADAFDRFSLSAGAIYDAMVNGRPRHFSLWRKPDLVARLRAGQTIPGFVLEGGEVHAALDATFTTAQGAPHGQLTADIAAVWDKMVWPVSIGNMSPEADIDAALETLNGFRQAAAAAESATVMTVLHEVVESTLITEVIRSPDRRWFCEGVANWLALRVVRERWGSERAKAHYDPDALVVATGTANLTELEKWPSAEHLDAKHYPSELNAANYVRATWAIEQIARKFGPGFITAWLTEIRKTPAERANMQTVHTAFRTLAGAELPSVLSDLTRS
jgi:hypothetical protein